MGFLSGSLTFARFEITKDDSGEFGDSHLKTLAKRQIGSKEVDLLEEPSVGFTGGTHVFDTDFSQEKNIIGQALHFGVRIDTFSVPGNIKRAWMQIELNGIMTDNAGGRPTKAQREEANQAVEQRCADEAAKGNFKRMNVTSVLWDAATETLFIASNSEKNNETVLGLIESAFGIEVSPITPTRLALNYCEDDAEAYAALTHIDATNFADDAPMNVTWWNGMSENFDYLGNEFLMWLWWKWETDSTVMDLADESEVSGMFARTLALDCPEGESGKESISAESPVALPEANLAIRMGKLPRKAGLTLVRNAQQFDLTLIAESFGIGGCKISFPGETNSLDREDRVESVRQIGETLDLLYEAFLDQRISKKWKAETKKMRDWLSKETTVRRQAKAA